MSGGTAMYTLKPIVSLPRALHSSKVMYEIRNIHEERRSSDHMAADEIEIEIVADVKEQSPLPEYAALEARQEKILSQLAELKKQVSTLCDFLKQTSQVESAKERTFNKEAVDIDLVVNVNPRRPPYSLLALRKVYDDVCIRIIPYTHSSITGQVPEFLSDCGSSSRNVVQLSLIWKEVQDLEFKWTLTGYPLMGEVNLIRYMSRSLHVHNYENSPLDELTTIDAILDLSHCLHFEESQKKVQDILSLIGDKLGKISRSDEQKPSIADVAVWSVIKQISPKTLPSNLREWFDLHETIFK